MHVCMNTIINSSYYNAEHINNDGINLTSCPNFRTCKSDSNLMKLTERFLCIYQMLDWPTFIFPHWHCRGQKIAGKKVTWLRKSKKKKKAEKKWCIAEVSWGAGAREGERPGGRIAYHRRITGFPITCSQTLVEAHKHRLFVLPSDLLDPRGHRRPLEDLLLSLLWLLPEPSRLK